ncbi:Pkinase-domain-containing protein [Yamadazyma tenuis ATCC 10573]|uniref:mitogen-activated protein kinase kinase n=1 Tax=Candida tenuis (strain ATCC 10573 / BCRC 21748 / CBS 615 / JCM 9827 / NBRC 10315 / NRRL Y-1498 / VKM Y-70) TaxID=590646 RepID=G3BBY4_CANTC|nr:Pkinase-domain-containing protein [Yamadazyma tenuis ATCC 10573]EGV60114.1 Pkinase-domain-containing protein [Yamadazyma tenuis ATCC 10573]
MSNSGPIFNIPTRGTKPSTKLPSLTISSEPASGGDAAVDVNGGEDHKKPRRKPPPIDFSRINGSHSFKDMSPAPSHDSGDVDTSDGSTSTSAKAYGTTEGSSTSRSLNQSSSSVSTPANLIPGPEKDLSELMPDDWQILANSDQIVELNKLGEGNGGSVSKCRLRNGNKIFAMKLINTDSNPDIQKQIVRELQYNRLVSSENIVKYYGTFLIENQSMIGITMEYMGGKSLDAIYKRVIEIDPSNRVNEKVMGKIAESILKGLNYLHQQKIIHRDIKPSNILLDFQGNIKLCDFGVSGEVVNSLATTFVGTQYYMAPERIMGKPYTVNCDIWSLGLTLLEVSTGKFPFTNVDSLNTNLGPIELLQLILEYEPKLEDIPQENIFWSDSFKNFIHYCLIKNTEERPSPRQMLQHPWIISQQTVKVRMDKFVQQLWNY